MRSLVLILASSLIILQGCAVPIYDLNAKEPPRPPRPLDIPNIFFSDRVKGDSVKYFKDKVVFLADVGTSPYTSNVEAFMADKDGKTNLQKLTFATSGNTRNYITFARKIDITFGESKIFVEFSKVYRDPNPFYFLETIPGNPLIILDANSGNKLFEKEVESACCQLSANKKVAFIAKDEGAQGAGLLGLYIIGEDLNSTRIADLPDSIIANRSYRSGKEYLSHMEWKEDGIIFYTNQIEPGFWSGWVNRFREYRVNPDGSNLRLIKKEDKKLI
ncbi:MAG: hypothetical protein JW869_03585 [Candidatus Omnitrophica bacterium]|nr:hypothetical protein [Candidatus Omnitrophota bacterium]